MGSFSVLYSTLLVLSRRHPIPLASATSFDGETMIADEETLPSMIKRLQDPAEYVRIGALVELLSTDQEALPDLEAVVGSLEDPSQPARRLVVEVLVRYGAGGAPALGHGLDADQPLTIRVAAANCLARLGPDAAPAMDLLCLSLQDKDAELGWHSGFALSKIGPAAVPSLRSLLQSSDPQVVARAVDALERIGPEAKDALEDIQQLGVGEASPQLRLACATTLISLTGDPASGKPVVAEALASADVELRKACIERLGYLGSAAAVFEEELLQGSKDASGEVRAASALALARVFEDPAKAVPALTPLLDDSDPEVRANAAMALARYGPASAPALPKLQALHQDQEERVAAVAAAAIGKIQG
jgi:HEAT repeat protein